MTTETFSSARTLAVPGAVLVYDVRQATSAGSGAVGSAAVAAPPLFLIGSPMGASGFGTLASHFADRTVVTYDPRGVERSTKDDRLGPSTPEEHADDLSRVIAALGVGPVDLFASSGGAVNALALVAAHPEQVRILVAHEPPLAAILPDREFALVACQAIQDAYRKDGLGAGMARFIAIVSHKGPIDAAFLERPAPDPAMFGLPTEDDGNRADPLLGQNMRSSTTYEPDFDALRAASTRIVIGVGVESEGELAHRGGEAAAAGLGTEPVLFPSGHSGFLGDEYGQPGDPVGFAATLCEVLGG
ncbi:MAG: alpha/beta hydrolase [Chloroflexota bacterium]